MKPSAEILFQLGRAFCVNGKSGLCKRTFTMMDFGETDMRAVAPDMTADLHKGQMGRIGIIGGSREYTGAPYFAGITALRLGADLVHIFCSDSAGTAIKCYSPDLIVHPILDDGDAVKQVTSWLDRLHAVVIGPGLGREPKIFKLVEDLIGAIRGMNKLVVIDGDGLFLISEKPDLISGYPRAVLTPNIMEYKRLQQKLGISLTSSTDAQVVSSPEEVMRMSALLGGVIIVRKGKEDVIACSNSYTLVRSEGSTRRCGGQGDVLSGAMALLCYWTSLRAGTEKISAESALLLGAFHACQFTRKLSYSTQKSLKTGHSMLASDLVDNIRYVFDTPSN